LSTASSLSKGFKSLWPTPVSVSLYPAASDVNQVLARVFSAMRVADRDAEQTAAFYSSSDDLMLEIAGAWFQIQNHGAFHDIHNHGNCSWSGVYYVQIDQPEQRRQHKALGALNGITRFYGPYQNWLGGAYMDMGNAYLQQPHFDVSPEPGMLVLFPAYLNHKAMPYEGEADRIIVSFNAQIHGAQGDQMFNHAAA
jgi:hypothetical protein